MDVSNPVLHSLLANRETETESQGYSALVQSYVEAKDLQGAVPRLCKPADRTRKNRKHLSLAGLAGLLQCFPSHSIPEQEEFNSSWCQVHKSIA